MNRNKITDYGVETIMGDKIIVEVLFYALLLLLSVIGVGTSFGRFVNSLRFLVGLVMAVNFVFSGVMEL